MRRILVSIGVSDYDDEAYSRLPNAVGDAAKMDAFFKSKTLGENRFNSTLLSNPSASDVTKLLEEKLKLLDDGSIFIFYFAGHAIQERNSARQWLLCRDALGCVAEGEEGTGAISSGYVRSFKRRGKGRIFFCIDACRSEPVLGRGDSGLMGMNEFGDVSRDASSRANNASSSGYASTCWTLLSCASGQKASDNGAFVDALIDVVDGRVAKGLDVRLGDEFVLSLTGILQKRNRRQQPESSGSPFLLVPGKTATPTPPETTVTPPARPTKTALQLTTEANAALQSGRYEVAERLATEALRLDPSFGWAQFVLADARKKLAERREEERRRRELDRTLNEGWLCFNKGDAKLALAKATTVLKARPDDLAARELKRLAEAALQSDVKFMWAESPSRKAGVRQTLKIGNAEYGFCWIPAGEFDMGSPESEEDRWDDETLHHVKLTRGFWMLETPTTQALYKEVMGENPSKFEGDDLPVESVSWDDATKFCQELTKRLPKGVKASLPTEAQWEYACRAGTTTPYSFGSALNGDKANCNGNYPYGTSTKGKYLEKTTPVKSYAPNPWGLYDMHGNVSEWCLDYYGDYPSGTVIDPEGPSNASYRVHRGGGWHYLAWNCRSAYRNRSSPVNRYSNLGFRFLLVCD